MKCKPKHKSFRGIMQPLMKPGPEMKEQWKQWISPLAGKVTISQHEYTDYLEKWKTIIGFSYASLLNQFYGEMMKNWPHFAKKKITIHQLTSENCDGQHCRIELQTALSSMPLWHISLWIDGERFTSNEEVIFETIASFPEFKESNVLEGLKKLENHWTKCIKLKGNHVKTLIHFW